MVEYVKRNSFNQTTALVGSKKVKYFRYSTPLSKLCCFAFSNSRPLEPHSPNFLVRAKGVENYQYISCFFVQIIPHIWYNSCRSIRIQYATNIDNCRMANVRFWRLPRKQMITIAFDSSSWYKIGYLCEYVRYGFIERS